MKIKYKISLIAAAICIICVGAMWAVNNFISLKYLEDTIQDKVLAEVKIKANDINEWIAEEKQNLEIIAERVKLAEDYEFDTLFKVLSGTGNKSYEDFYYLALENGALIGRSKSTTGEAVNLQTEEWYVKAKGNRGQIYICDPYVDVNTKNVVFTLSKEITLKNGTTGILGVDVQISDMNELINGIGQDKVDTETSASLNVVNYESSLNKANKSYAFLIDRQGNIINHPNPDFSIGLDKVTNAADILGGKLNILRKQDNSSLYQRIIKDYDGKERAFFFDKLEGTDWSVGIAVDKDTILEAKDKFEKISLLIAIMLLCAGVAVSLITAGNIAKPIMTTKTIANNISDLKLNVEIDDKYLKRKDEAGEIVKAIKETKDRLRDFAAGLNELSAINNKIYNTTFEKANTLLNISEGVSATTKQLSAGMEETSASARSISQSVEDLNNSVSVFLGKAEEGAETANEIARKAAELDRQFIESKDNTMNMLNVAKDEVESAVESAKNVEQVKMLADAILDIAEKTNLLSLNASIEAARAGENGKGFAVVAEEIRILSEDSNKSAGRIKQFTENINTSVNKLISATNNLLKFLNENVLNDYSLMLNTVKSYKNDGAVFSRVLGELSKTVRELTETTNNITIAINSVSSTIQQATAATADIAERNSEIANAIQDINNAMQMSIESSNKLTNMIVQVKL